MSKLMKFFFTVLQISSLSFISAYFLAMVTVGAAGHVPGDTDALMVVLCYAALLAFLLSKYERAKRLYNKPNSLVRGLILLMLLPMIGLSCLFAYMIVQELIAGRTEFLIALIFMLIVFVTCALSGIVVLRYIILSNRFKLS